MFKSLNYVEDGRYRLVDTDFTCLLSCQERISIKTLAVIKEYQRRGLPIAPNVARLYLYWGTETDYPNYESRCRLLDKHHPKLQFGKLYYACVMRQMKQLQFGRRR
jgi:hypothetical protein